MNLLLHICCACCLCAPLNELRKEGFEVTGLFYNPNIHPFLEFRRRLKALRVFQESDPIPVIYYEEYGIREYLKNVDYEGDDRCADCYALRLKFTADYAKGNGFDAFTSTMLFSVYQNHEQLKMIYRQGYCGCVFSEYERYKDTTRELYKGNSPYNKENSRKILGTEKELQRCDCFG